MAENILEKIIEKKISKVNNLKKDITIDSLKDKIEEINSFINFKEKIENNIKSNKISIIAEIKKASPSAGIIINDYDPLKIAEIYKSNKATCLSVLTEEDFFFGNLSHISEIKKKINLPILCKDFFVDPYQVYLAKSFGADAILIILAAIDEKTSKDIFSVAEELNISTIVEVHTQEEAKKALYFKNSIIGINNRNLKTLETDLKTTYDLHKDLAKHVGPIICESGIKSEKEVEEIVKKTKINNFLIGESLLKDLNKKTSLFERILKISP